MATMRFPYQQQSPDSTDQLDFSDPSQYGGFNEMAPPQQAAPPAAPPAPAPFTPMAGAPNMDTIEGLYKQDLGRDVSPDEYQTYWGGGNGGFDPNYAQSIFNSPEAQAFRAKSKPAPEAPAPRVANTTIAAYNPGQYFEQSPSPLAAAPSSTPDIMQRLKSLFDAGGGFNQDLVNRRTESAKETLGRQRNQTLKNDKAYLADRGLMGDGTANGASGPEAAALNYLDTNTNGQYTNAVSNIYANESENASQRMMQALQEAGGLSQSDAQSLISAYEAQTGRALGLGSLDNQRTLGLGNLALGNMNGVNNYNLGLGSLGLQRDLGLANIDNAQVSQLMDLIKQLMGGANSSAQGYF